MFKKEKLELTDTSLAGMLTWECTLLVKVEADWCAPCHALVPVLGRVEAEFPKVLFATLDADINPETLKKYGVRSLPTLLLFRDGQLLDSKVGVQSEAALREWLQSTLG